MPELLITLVLGAIVASMGTPMIARLRDTFAVRSARQEIVATVEAARAAATQRGRTARFIVRGNAVLAIADTAGPGQPVSGTFTVLAPQPFDAAYKVQLTVRSPSDTVVAYDARGFANPRVGHVARLVITARAVVDSVCLSNFGQLLPPGCAP